LYDGLDKTRELLFDIAKKNGITILRDEKRSEAIYHYDPLHIGYINGGYGREAKKILNV
jgi:hypothetical protein